MSEANQASSFAIEEPPTPRQVQDVILAVLSKHEQPSAWDLISAVERELGWKARWAIKAAVDELKSASALTKARRSYLISLTESSDLDAALKGADAPKKEIASSIDSLLRHSKVYQDSEAFREMISFMARFRDYAPYNNMLVRVQNPTCSFYATEHDWNDRFGRTLKEDARPMLILAPMHPVMLVYALDETTGPVPKGLTTFAKFEGEWDPEWLRRTVLNAANHDRIRVDFKPLSSTNAGFATTLVRGTGEWKMRIAIHSELDQRSQPWAVPRRHGSDIISECDFQSAPHAGRRLPGVSVLCHFLDLPERTSSVTQEEKPRTISRISASVNTRGDFFASSMILFVNSGVTGTP